MRGDLGCAFGIRRSMRAIERGLCNPPLVLKQNLIKECLRSSLQTGSRADALRAQSTKWLLTQKRTLLEWLVRQDRGKLFSLNKTCQAPSQFRCLAEKKQRDKNFCKDWVRKICCTAKYRIRFSHEFELKVLTVNTWTDKASQFKCHFPSRKYDRYTLNERLDHGDILKIKSTDKGLFELTFERQLHNCLAIKTRVEPEYLY